MLITNMIMNVCRICLAQGPDKDIKHLKLPKKETHKSYIEIMLFCLDIQVAEDSKVTSKVCTKCFKKIITYYKFKALAMKNDTYLRSLETNIKEENDAKDIRFVEKISYIFEEDAMCKKIKQEEDSLDESAQVEFDSLDDSAQVHDDESDDELLSVIKMMKNENNVEVTIENSEKETTTNSVKETKENGSKRKTKQKRKRGRTKFTTIKCKGTRAPKKLEICEECGKATRNLSAHSKAHLPEAKGNEKQCEICKKMFANARSCRKHNLFVHMGYRKKCPICGKGVTQLNNHILIMHQQDQLPYQCTVCQRRFLKTGMLEKHMVTHTKDKPYSCDVCNKRFSQKICMENHVKQIHENEKNHLCQFCSKGFFKKHHLVVHLRKHTKEKPYECPECGKCFSSTNGLKSHRMIHSDVKPYHCTVCDYKFSKPDYLRTHMRTHTKEKRHPCKYCGVLFGRSDHRKRHEFTAHEKDLVQVT